MNPKDFVVYDPSRIKWNTTLFKRVKASLKMYPNESRYFIVEYRPFTKCWCYLDAQLVDACRDIPKIFQSAAIRLRTICTNSALGSPDLASWMVKHPPDGEITRAAMCFPMYSRFANTMNKIGDFGLRREDSFNLTAMPQRFYGCETNKDDMFYYVYGILSCPEYIVCYKRNLGREIPRIPAVVSLHEFLEFAEAGRKLADLHVEYDQAEEYSVAETWIHDSILSTIDTQTKFRVEKMKFLNKNDKSTLQYNPYLKISGIPDEAYDFTVNGKSLVEWVMDRQRVSVHKDSGIENDANDFANETMNDPAYPLKLLKKAITVGIKTREIQRSMPPLRIHKKMSG